MQATIDSTAIRSSQTRSERQLNPSSARSGRKSSIMLWTIQGLLAVTFLFAGGTKLVMTTEQMAPLAFGLPTWFLRFLGVAEVLGAVGLILPGVLRIRVGLTPLAAAGLVVIMIGATSLTAASGDIAGASFPALLGVFCAFIAYRRSRAIV